jgi:cation diffusion facilitator CzcD-associated flavoprotein CzcO
VAYGELETSHGALVAGSVVVASGFQNAPRRPTYADTLPSEIVQLHVADYRRPDELEDAVLVVGGGQSGVQIAEDLLEAGRRVYLSTSRVGRVPRRYRAVTSSNGCGRPASSTFRASKPIRPRSRPRFRRYQEPPEDARSATKGL